VATNGGSANGWRAIFDQQSSSTQNTAYVICGS
jgi:hypothetical protein